MVVVEEDLGLTLGLRSPTKHAPLRLDLMVSSPSSSPFPRWSDLLSSTSGRRSSETPLRRGIDVNRAPEAERESEEEEEEEEEEEDEEGGAASPNSTLSSLSGKREAERASDEEEGGDGSRKKLRLSMNQSAILEENFKEHSTLEPKRKVALAKQLNLRPRQVEVWFQNRRARTKLKQTEVDCEVLRRCCEELTEENRRLQKEVQELRALKLLSPLFCAHATPPTTLTMCPSCERVSNAKASDRRSRRPAPAAAAGARPQAPWVPIPLRPTRLHAQLQLYR
ncbi:homeobox-leucine zipper protein HOX1-like [Ananas comosus]|uniref:Homeobox-leucine zipper protein HOX1-like n=1 Tax=Ananas comosus TaxID=4615 RepID=A0A6P5FLH8_ANACO|nr:homeobox-leucine zipper protein HOX1-like [Ananas comosus]